MFVGFLNINNSNPSFSSQKKYECKPLLTIWNAMLAIFSMYGCYHVSLPLIRDLFTVGLDRTVCWKEYYFYEWVYQVHRLPSRASTFSIIADIMTIRKMNLPLNPINWEHFILHFCRTHTPLFSLYSLYRDEADEENQLRKKLAYWLYLFCLSKFPELFDTAFIVAKKAPLQLLQTYHHATVLVFSWHILAYGPAASYW